MTTTDARRYLGRRSGLRRGLGVFGDVPVCILSHPRVDFELWCEAYQGVMVSVSSLEKHPVGAGFGGAIMETSGAFDTLTGTGRALAIAVLLATVASPTAADVCSDFRAALALRDVAWRTLIEHIEAGSTDVDAVANAYYEADLAIGIPARAVERTIDDEAATATIEAVRTVRRGMNLAFEKVRVWFPTRPRVPAPFLPFYIKMSEADGTLSEAYHEALIAAACR